MGPSDVINVVQHVCNGSDRPSKCRGKETSLVGFDCKVSFQTFAFVVGFLIETGTETGKMYVISIIYLNKKSRTYKF